MRVWGLLWAAVLTLAGAGTRRTRVEWSCEGLRRQDLGEGVLWETANCTAKNHIRCGPLRFNILRVPMGNPNVVVTPLVAGDEHVMPLHQMAHLLPYVVGGVNGGYFWRVDSSSFVDDVCWGKTRTEATRPATLDRPNAGVGDALTVVNGTLLSSNCNCPGFNRPTVLTIDGEKSYITVLETGKQLNADNAIGAGPNLVSCCDRNVPFVDIPRDDENVNIFGHTANTAVGLTSGAKTLLMVTADGRDGCDYEDPTCGISAEKLGYFMKDYLNATHAMNMDQGGSTTMYVAGQPNGGIVSCSDSPNCPQESTRSVWNGLFVRVLPH